MNNYELMFILKTSLEDEARADLIKRFTELITQNGGTIDKIDEWGQRTLAYPIQKLNDGYYVLVTFASDGELPKEIERNLKIADNVIRYMTVRLDD